MRTRSRLALVSLLLLSLAAPNVGAESGDLDELAGKTVAYFSLELASPVMRGQRTGGLGVLAMDLVRGTARAIAPVKGKVVGVTLLYRTPWSQSLRADGEQVLSSKPIEPEEWVRQGKLAVALDAAGRPIEFPIEVAGKRTTVRVFSEKLGDAEVLRLHAPGVTEMLYNGDQEVRLRQELLLARGGLEALKRAGLRPDVLHLNESHTAFVSVFARRDPFFESSARVGTSHTPVEAGLERFPSDWFPRFGLPEADRALFQRGLSLDLTQAMMRTTEIVNGVSEEHAAVMRKLYPDFSGRIVAVQNGVDPVFWQHPSLQNLATRKLEGDALRRALWSAKQPLRQTLLDEVARRTGRELRADEPILAFTRRVTEYKDTLPMLKDHIRQICGDRAKGGLGMQVVVAGVAHPRDEIGKSWIREFDRWSKDPALGGRFVFVPDYLGPHTDLELDRIAVQGADVWLSSPRRPPRSDVSMEASGTSDRRSVLNLGIQIWSPDTGGGRDYIVPFNRNTGRGNGFFIEPYTPAGLFAQIRTVADLFYGFKQKGDPAYLRLLENVYGSFGDVGIERNVRSQVALTYAPALRGREIRGMRMNAATGRISVADTLPVRAEVDIGKVHPDALRVELWWGRPGRAWQATPMKLVGAAGGRATFAGDLAPLEGGAHRYTVRVATGRGETFRWLGSDGHVDVDGDAPKVWEFTDAQKHGTTELRPEEPLVVRNRAPFTLLSGHDGRGADTVIGAVKGANGEYEAVIRPGAGARWLTFQWQQDGGRVIEEGRRYRLDVKGAIWKKPAPRSAVPSPPRR